MTKKTLGIIGGVGPLATMLIGEMIVRLTEAEKDQDHVDMIITNNPHIPDRTAFILGKSDKDPVPVILSDAERLRVAGAEILAIPCNTAHSFFGQIKEGTDLTVIDMIGETAARAARDGAKRIGILGTTGTIITGVYQTACERYGMTAVVPDEHIQSVVMSLIYDDVKAGKPADREKWSIIKAAMDEAGCDKVILGCTELSVVNQELALGAECIDSLLVLAETAIERCGHTLKG
ncbi:aspartate/glutamate racemase family protein [Sporosarcina sp. NPDC096371]|uniref:aspartate/glutamate racemase family protein n=1 Tax=Sporosarcina sp. NPDC096371 TaxID=3364530 RepID=UPI0037F3B30E